MLSNQLQVDSSVFLASIAFVAHANLFADDTVFVSPQAAWELQPVPDEDAVRKRPKHNPARLGKASSYGCVEVEGRTFRKDWHFRKRGQFTGN